MKLWHWQLLGLSVLLAPLAVTGTATAISRGHIEFVAVPAILYIGLVAGLVRHASSAATHMWRPKRAHSIAGTHATPSCHHARDKATTGSGVG